MSTTEAMEMLDQGKLTKEDIADLRAHVWGLTKLVLEAMENPPFRPPTRGKDDWEERAQEMVGDLEAYDNG